MLYLVEYLFYNAELKKSFLQCFTKTEHAAALQRRIYYSECLGAFPYFCLSNDKQMHSLGKTNYKRRWRLIIQFLHFTSRQHLNLFHHFFIIRTHIAIFSHSFQQSWTENLKRRFQPSCNDTTKTVGMWCIQAAVH